jgi:hypothetical protein
MKMVFLLQCTVHPYKLPGVIFASTFNGLLFFSSQADFTVDNFGINMLGGHQYWTKWSDIKLRIKLFCNTLKPI